MSNKYRKHQNLIAEILPRLQQAFPQARFFSRHVGLFYTKIGTPVKINKKGMSDVWAIFKTKYGALFLEFEFKSGQAIKSKEQKEWGKFLETMGAQSIEVREDNFDEVVSKTKKALNL